jgi:hypothetical protein
MVFSPSACVIIFLSIYHIWKYRQTVHQVCHGGKMSFDNQSKKEHRPALVLTIYSGMTPLIGIVMLVIGLLAGYFFRPATPAPQVVVMAPTAAPQTAAPAAAKPTQAAAAQPQDQPTAKPTVDPAVYKKIAETLTAKVRHWEGDPNAAVTLLEFSDFQ